MTETNNTSDRIAELEGKIRFLEEALAREKTDRENFFNEMVTGFAECEMIFSSEGKPVDFRFISVNRIFCIITGFSSEDVTGNTYCTLFPDTGTFLIDKSHSILQGKSAPVFEFFYPGTSGYYEISIKKVSGTRFRSYFHDITFYKFAEKNLRKSEERFNLAMTGTNDGLWDWDLRTDYVYYSPRWKSMLGYDPDELKNHISTWESLTHPDDREKTMILFNEYMSGNNEKFEIINRMKHKNGSWRLILARALKQFDNADNNPVRLVGTHTDVTDLMDLLSNLKELNSTKDKFFSIVAHDLRGPLSSQMALIDMILEDSSMSREEIKELLKEAHNNSRNIFSLLENLLLWAQSQMNYLPVHCKAIETSSLIKENIQLMGSLAKDKGIMITSGLAENLSAVADPDILRFVIRNILSNAIKFSYRNGLVEIISYRKNDDKVYISVTDHGKGIESERLELLFNSSQIISTQGTENEKGSGLGLILCKDFIEKIGGEIIIENRRCKGTTVTIILQG